ncbi:MAG: zinc ribbon domain-containing protein [Desulfovermiculus sp.]|nr:zinc ribbon domain-containing protein [Desulfovermiculus sp.]
MPIYEFYCSDCHTIFNFFTPRVNTSARPDCPQCGRSGLERRASLFSISKNRPDQDQDDMPDIDESKMEQAMQMMSREAEGIDEDDPRQAAQLMKRLCSVTGLEMGPGMQEAMRRLEAGEDPDQVEADMGDVLENDELFTMARRGGRLKHQPKVDETIYDL